MDQSQEAWAITIVGRDKLSLILQASLFIVSLDIFSCPSSSYSPYNAFPWVFTVYFVDLPHSYMYGLAVGKTAVLFTEAPRRENSTRISVAPYGPAPGLYMNRTVYEPQRMEKKTIMVWESTFVVEESSHANAGTAKIRGLGLLSVGMLPYQLYGP